MQIFQFPEMRWEMLTGVVGIMRRKWGDEGREDVAGRKGDVHKIFHELLEIGRGLCTV